MIFTEKQLRNFWNKVDPSGPVHVYNMSLGRCWIWTGATINNKNVYGKLSCDRISYLSHRFSLLIIGRNIPKNKQVNHTCCNTLCLNPMHLEVVSRQEDSDYKCSLNRQARVTGEKCGTSKLKDKDILEIINIYSSGDYTLTEIGNMYNVHNTTISRVIRRKTWSHV